MCWMCKRIVDRDEKLRNDVFLELPLSPSNAGWWVVDTSFTLAPGSIFQVQ